MPAAVAIVLFLSSTLRLGVLLERAEALLEVVARDLGRGNRLLGHLLPYVGSLLSVFLLIRLTTRAIRPRQTIEHDHVGRATRASRCADRSHSVWIRRRSPSRTSDRPRPSVIAPARPIPIHRPAPLSGPIVSCSAYALTRSTASAIVGGCVDGASRAGVPHCVAVTADVLSRTARRLVRHASRKRSIASTSSSASASRSRRSAGEARRTAAGTGRPVRAARGRRGGTRRAAGRR